MQVHNLYSGNTSYIIKDEVHVHTNSLSQAITSQENPRHQFLLVGNHSQLKLAAPSLHTIVSASASSYDNYFTKLGISPSSIKHEITSNFKS